MAADWSKLPLDPLGAIAMKFDVFEDLIRFSAVCQEWNRATSLVEHQWEAPLPSLLLAENTKENPDGVRKILDLNYRQIYQLKLPKTFGTRCWGSPYGWVAIADDNRSVQLFNPITNAQIHFPSFKFLTHYHDDEDDTGKKYWFLIYFLFKLIVVKVSQNDKHEFVLMVIYDNNQYVDFARPGDKTWTSISTKEFKMDETRMLVTKVVDIVAKNDDIFALYGDGSIVHWHVGDFCSGKLLTPTDYSPPGTLDIVSRSEFCSGKLLTPPDYSPLGTLDIVSRSIRGQLQKYLVESHGDLFLVVRYKEEYWDKEYWDTDGLDLDIGYLTKVIDVFKLTQHNGWEKIEDLGNVAIFVGGNYTMSISLGVDQRMLHNGIYFTDDEYEYWQYPRDFGGHDTGFYDMKLNESRFYQIDDMRSSFCTPTWFISKL